MKNLPWTIAGAVFALMTVACDDAGSDDGDPSGSESGESGDSGEPMACPAPTGPTLHDGELGLAEVWTAEGSPHIVTQWVRVPEAATLKIEPCAEVRLQEDAALVFGSANASAGPTLIAEGEPGKEIRFVRDGEAPWSAIVVYEPARASLTHAVLEGGGADRFLYNASLVIRGDGETPSKRPVHVEDVTIRGSLGHGAVAEWAGGFDGESRGLVVTDSGNEAFPFPVRVGEHGLDTLPAGDYRGNAIDEVLIMDEGANKAAGLQEDATLRERGVPYRVGDSEVSSLRIGGEAGLTTLTIEAGVVLRFTPGTVLEVEHWTSDVEPATGAVIAMGTAERPIVFTSAADVPAAGDWVGLWFGSVPAASNRIDHAVVEYAGGECGCVGFTCTGADEGSVLFVSGVPASGFVTNTTIRRGAGHGFTRGWQSGGPDFTASNRFEDVAGCAQTMPRDDVPECGVGDGCG